MIVCDLCKRNRASEEFWLPLYQTWYAMSDGKRLSDFKKLTKSQVVICKECQQKIASFVSATFSLE